MKRMPVDQVARHTDIPRSRIYVWLRQERLTVVYRDGVATVNPDEVLELDALRKACGGSLPFDLTL